MWFVVLSFLTCVEEKNLCTENNGKWVQMKLYIGMVTGFVFNFIIY